MPGMMLQLGVQQFGLLKAEAEAKVCREPPQEITPMTGSRGRELLGKASGLKGLPRLPQASTPKQESVCFTIS